VKKFLMFCFAALNVLILAGCADTPQEVAHQWGEAILAGDLASANKFSSPETHRINEAIISDFAGNAEHRSRFKSNWQQLPSAEVVIDGDIAQIIIDGRAALALVRIDGKWKVHINVQSDGQSGEESESSAGAEAAARAQAEADSRSDAE